MLVLCRGALHEKLASLSNAEATETVSRLSSRKTLLAGTAHFWTQMTLEWVCCDLLTWSAIEERLRSQSEEEAQMTLTDPLRAVLGKVKSIFAGMSRQEVRLLLVLLRLQGVVRTMRGCGLASDTVRALQTLIAHHLGLLSRPHLSNPSTAGMSAEELLPLLAPAKSFLLLLIDCAAELGMQSAAIARSRRRRSKVSRPFSRSIRPSSTTPSLSSTSGSPDEAATFLSPTPSSVASSSLSPCPPSVSYNSILVGYRVSAELRLMDACVDSEGGLPRPLGLETGYCAPLTVIFSIHVKLIQLLDDCYEHHRLIQVRAEKKNEKKENEEEEIVCERKEEKLFSSQSKRAVPSSSLCVCGLPIGNWSFVGLEDVCSSGNAAAAAVFVDKKGRRLSLQELVQMRLNEREQNGGGGGKGPERDSGHTIDEDDAAIRASINRTLCERCYRAVLLFAQSSLRQTQQQLLVQSGGLFGDSLYLSGSCPIMRSRAAANPTFEQVYRLNDRIAEYVDYKVLENNGDEEALSIYFSMCSSTSSDYFDYEEGREAHRLSRDSSEGNQVRVYLFFFIHSSECTGFTSSSFF